MKELNVQKYLRSGKTLEQLKEELGIKFSIYKDLVILNYSQIDSPKTNPIVMECRSLILQLDSWDIISMAFHRFFNYGEAPEITENIDLNTALAQEKIDGSIISVFYHNEWLMSTRGSIMGQGTVGFNDITFYDLFSSIVNDKFYQRLDKDYTYIFEITSIENRVVKHYNERALYLLGVRDSNFNELHYENIVIIHNYLKGLCNIKLPQIYHFNKFEELLELHQTMNASDEGFVVVNYNQNENGNFMRVKVKNPAYVALAHMKESGGASLRCILQLIILNEEKEFLLHFPEFQSIFNKVKIKYDEYVEKLENDSILALQLIVDGINQKDYAIKVKGLTNTSFLFMLKAENVKNVRDYFISQIEMKGVKVIAKNLLKTLNLKDVNLQEEL